MMDYNALDEKLVNTIKKYMPTLELDDAQDLVNDIIESMDKYSLLRYDEYFKYDFANLSPEQRSTFFGGKDYSDCVKNSFDGSYDDCTIFKNKLDTYEIYKDYYKRDVISVKGFEDFSTFVDFVSRNKVFIVKELMGSLGMNIKKFVIHDASQIKSVFFSLLQYEGGCICEGWINQCEAFSDFCKDCVNTVRIATIYDDRGLTKVYGMFRTGRDGSIVDNASLGGIAAAIDVESGTIISDGYTKTSFEHFERHPNSNKKYSGFKIPKWDELMLLIEKLHGLYKESRYVGWDFTLTDEGWVLIEGNGKPNIDTIQMIHSKTFGHGLCDVIENALGRYRNV